MSIMSFEYTYELPKLWHFQDSAVATLVDKFLDAQPGANFFPHLYKARNLVKDAAGDYKINVFKLKKFKPKSQL